MARLKTIYPIIFCLGLVIAGCLSEENPPPEDLIPEDTYIDLMIEVQLAKSLQEKVFPDSNVTDSLMPKIMKKYGVSMDQFKRSHTYYQQQIPEQQQRINEAIERLREDYYMQDTTQQ